MTAPGFLSWAGIARLGLVQMCIGSIVVLTTSLLNRLMVVELSLPALLPGLLVGLHYGVQLSRPHWGFKSDMAGHRAPWIVGGLAVLAAGALGATGALALFETRFGLGVAVAILSYTAIGLGVGASGTSLLALLARGTAPRRRAAAAMITWLMMIAGIALTAGGVGAMLDPYSFERLVRIVSVVGAGSVALSTLAVWQIERNLRQPDPTRHAESRFGDALREVWSDPPARIFTIFIAVSMTAYFMQELILEPYAGLVFAYAPGQSTMLSGLQNGAVFVGMLVVGIAATGLRIGTMRAWVIAGCLGSAASLGLIAALGQMGPHAPLAVGVGALGLFNGMFAVAAIGAMMTLAGAGHTPSREGTRMGLWGAAQALAAGFGGLLGAAAVDLLRAILPSDATAFAFVFVAEGTLFFMAALLALNAVGDPSTRTTLVAGE